MHAHKHRIKAMSGKNSVPTKDYRYILRQSTAISCQPVT